MNKILHRSYQTKHLQKPSLSTMALWEWKWEEAHVSSVWEGLGAQADAQPPFRSGPPFPTCLGQLRVGPPTCFLWATSPLHLFCLMHLRVYPLHTLEVEKKQENKETESSHLELTMIKGGAAFGARVQPPHHTFLFPHYQVSMSLLLLFFFCFSSENLKSKVDSKTHFLKMISKFCFQIWLKIVHFQSEDFFYEVQKVELEVYSKYKRYFFIALERSRQPIVMDGGPLISLTLESFVKARI